MSNPGDRFQIPATYQSPSLPSGEYHRQEPVGGADSRLPLLNLSKVRARMDSLHDFLAQSVNSDTLIGKDQMDMVSTEISSAIHQIIVNGAALLTCSQLPPPPQHTNPKRSGTDNPNPRDSKSVDERYFDLVDLKIEDDETKDETPIEDMEIIELDSVELLAEHIHFCDICGKGFKRDANLRMHMRAHGNQFKTPEALAKPERNPPPDSIPRKTRFSCPFVGCGRNKSHGKFKPLKSVICVKNHFKRSHCPKMYSCNRCNKKSFSVVADLKSHLKHCGESKWKCSCGTTFSRKDKLFGHIVLFAGHMPAVDDDNGESSKVAAPAAMVGVEEKDANLEFNSSLDDGFFDGLLDDFGSIENYCLQDVLERP